MSLHKVDIRRNRKSNRKPNSIDKPKSTLATKIKTISDVLIARNILKGEFVTAMTGISSSILFKLFTKPRKKLNFRNRSSALSKLRNKSQSKLSRR